MFFTIEIYEKKLVNIKNEILNIHERTSKLKKSFEVKATKTKIYVYEKGIKISVYWYIRIF